MKKLACALAVLASLALPSWGQTHARQVASMAASCAACHGTNGMAQQGMAALAGMPREAFVKSMQDFKSGARTATIMHQLSKGYTDAQIEQLAVYFAAQKK
jgi:cytochrome subunit of sulfide dehydrogenase